MPSIPAGLVPQFRADVDAILSVNGRRDALSHVLSELRERGWKNLGSCGNLEIDLEANGYEIEHVYKNGGRFISRTYVKPRPEAK